MTFPLALLLILEPATQAEPAAQATEAAQAAQPSTTVAPGGATDAWDRRYEEARGQLVAGKFAACSRMFSDLLFSSPDQLRRARAAEVASLCRTWAAGGYELLVPSRGGDGGNDSAGDGRTIDELAVLYTTAVVYGVGAGVALATWTEPDSPAGGILPALGFAGAAVGTVALLDHNGWFRYGAPQSTASGLLIGLEEGMAWTLWNQARVRYDREWKTSTIAGVWWAGATVGAAAGGVLGTVYGSTPGRAALMGSGALWFGLVAGLAGAAFTGNDDTRDDHGWLAAALALNVGAAGGAYLGAQVSPSIARVRFVDLGAIAGGLTLGGLYWAAAGKQANERSVMTSLTLGVAAGVAAAWYLTRDMTPDHPRSREAPQSLMPVLVPLVGGALVGMAGAF